MHRALLPLLLSATVLSACSAGGGHYPSLLPRETEGQGVTEPERPPVVAAPDPALDARIAELTAGVDKAKAAFGAAAQEAEAQVAVSIGLPEGSEGWVNAQKALALLGARRSGVLEILQSLEEIAIERGVAGKPPYPALDSAIADLRAASQAQDARMETLEASLAGR